MRFNSVTVRNYRIHRDTTVKFDPKLTLITGPNESGKSTLIESIHRALFLRSQVGGRVRAGMTSVWGEPPEVILGFEAGPQTVSLRKVFRGNHGDCSLDVTGEVAPPHGDAAEQRLAKILSVEGALEGRNADSLLLRWAHLWVWQGNSGVMPTETVTEQQDTLVQRLQAKGGAAVTQSDLDARVLRTIRERCDELFTDKWKPKVQSDFAKAEAEVDMLRRALLVKKQNLQMLEDAAISYASAASRILEKSQTLDTTTRELEETEQKHQQAEALTRNLEPIRQKQNQFAAAIAELEKIARDLGDAREKHDKAKAALVPYEQSAVKMLAERDACRERLKTAEDDRDRARVRATVAQRWQNALTDHLQALEQKRMADKLTSDAQAIAAIKVEISKEQEEITRTPQVEDKSIAALHKCQQEIAAAEATLAALGARIEVVASRNPVSVGGRSVAVGEREVITTDTEVTIDPDTILRICPGGHTSIAGARDVLNEKQSFLADKLNKLGTASVEDAVVACERLKVLKAKIESLGQELKRLNADENEKALRDAEQSYAETSRRASMAAKEVFKALPEALAATQSARRTSDEECRNTEQEEKTADSTYNGARAKSEQVETDLQKAVEDTEKARAQQRDADVRTRTLEEQHGDDKTRTRRLLELRGNAAEAVEQQTTLEKQLSALQPEQLVRDISRLKAVVKNAQDDIVEAKQDKAGTQERLKLHGTTDPHGDVVEAEARLEHAEARCAELLEQANAVRHLAELAEEMQKKASQRFIVPLADAARGYLECVFGLGTGIGLEWDPEDGRFDALQVNREAVGLGNFKFEQLSGGTREQIGIAMRLAMAEVLAADHNGCLPIVLDDAFANSDPERVKVLQRMLYLAAERGLQIIVLTCNPADYATLGAKEVCLQRPVLPGAAQPGLLPTRRDELAESEPEPAGPVSNEDKEAFLKKLTELGGRSGNQSLREALGSTPERYEATKQALLGSKCIVSGQGRGGSVRLSGATE